MDQRGIILHSNGDYEEPEFGEYVEYEGGYGADDDNWTLGMQSEDHPDEAFVRNGENWVISETAIDLPEFDESVDEFQYHNRFASAGSIADNLGIRVPPVPDLSNVEYNVNSVHC